MTGTQKSRSFIHTGDQDEFDPGRWSPGNLPSRSPDTSLKVLVVGAGPAGLVTALECWRKGHTIAGILERSESPVYTGTAAALCLSKGEPLLLRIALLSKYHAAIGIKENIVFMSLSPGVVATAKPEPKGDEIAKREEVRLKLKSYAPNFTKPLLPLDSVALQWNVIMGATVQSHGGEFVSHTGTSKWLSCDALPKDEIHGMASTKDILGTSSIKSAMSRASERNPMRERSRQNPIMALWLKLNPRQ
nr:fad-dependent monooxygenase mdpd [Quercus suber]